MAARASDWFQRCWASARPRNSCNYTQLRFFARNIDTNSFVYFHVPTTDVFWHNLDLYTQPDARSSKAELQEETLALHNKRLQQDYADYNEGKFGDASRLQELQRRLEQDMLDNAFVYKTQKAVAAISRGSNASTLLASQWMAAAQGGCSFLQDCIVFRNEPLEQLAASRDVPWFPSAKTVRSYQELIRNNLTPGNSSSSTDCSAWAPYIALVTPTIAMASGATRLQHALMHKAFNVGGKIQANSKPQVSQATSGIGAALIAATNAATMQLRLNVLSRGYKAANSIVSRAHDAAQPPVNPTVCLTHANNASVAGTKLATMLHLTPRSCHSHVQVQEALPVLAKLTKPPRILLQDNASTSVTRIVAKHLGHSQVTACNSTSTAVGAVILQLLINQLHGKALQPLFRQPIPWKFVAPEPTGADSQHDFELEPVQLPARELASYQYIVEQVTPIYGPCITPPLPWTSPSTGCYHLSNELKHFTVGMLRSKDPLQDRSLKKAVKQHSGPHQASLDAHSTAAEEAAPSGLQNIFNVLNILSSQSWSINSKILNVVQAVDMQQLDVADIPLRDPPRAPAPAGTHFHASVQPFLTQVQGKWRLASGPMLVTLQPLNEFVRRREAHNIAERQRIAYNIISQRGMFAMQLKSALEHEGYDAIYFPHNLDFRGRAYPMPPHLNHMGADLCRGILQFCEPRPLGDNGFRWLLIHLANLYGVVDKQAFDTRVLWSLERLPQILDSATSPLSGQRWWLGAEKPWSALAVCFDIASAIASGDVASYQSRLPVHQDGSCNGLQHYAALGRDEPGAFAVNLFDAGEPQDVYSQVVERFAQIVAKEAQGDDSLASARHARALIGHTDRKLVKQTVMTTVYGVTMRGARDQAAEDQELNSVAIQLDRFILEPKFVRESWTLWRRA